jgi:hypothetical protein
MDTLRFEIPRIPAVMVAVANWLLDETADDLQQELPFTDEVHATSEKLGVSPEELTALPETPLVPVNPFATPATGVPDGTSAEVPATGTEETVAPAAPTASPEFDTEGLPWDKRIHASTKSKLKSGAWKKMRGVDDHDVELVEAELRGAMASPLPAATSFTAAEASGLPPAPGSLEEARAATMATVAEPLYGTPPPPPPPAPEPTPEPAGIITLADLMLKIVSTDGVDSLKVQAALTELGVPSLPVLGSTRPDLIPEVARKLFG